MGRLKKLAIMTITAKAGMELTRRGARAVKSLFDSNTKHAQEHLIGETCRINTQHVSETFGEATFDDGAGDLLLHVRSASSHQLTRDDIALIVSYCATDNTYGVEPI